MPRLLLTVLPLLSLVACKGVGAPPAADPLVLDAGLHHLGDSVLQTWDEVPAEPEGTDFRLRFTARANEGEQVLRVRARDVDNRWDLLLNGRALGSLRVGKEMRSGTFVIPAGTLVDGENEFHLRPERTTDDIVFGAVEILPQPLREAFALGQVEVTVRPLADGRQLPVRLTISDPGGETAQLYYPRGDLGAVRAEQGLFYTASGAARFELPAGEYRLWASRGSEWGLDTVDFAVRYGSSVAVEVGLEQEVDTTGYIACDSHIHTLTFSGHGDASLEERLVTLAAEGVELAVATDHNHNTDYVPAQHELGLESYYTAVTGNEVTTEVGHFNAFPLDPEEEIPHHEHTDWVVLVDGMRAKGAQAVVLNHPRWPRIHTGPFGEMHLDRVSGERDGDRPMPFDAMELVNTTTEQRDPLFLFEDWFALLNYGETIRAVGTSDSHTVGDPVGQGRTYLRSATDDAAAIDVDEVCRSLTKGTSSIAQGIFTEIVVEGGHRMGSLVRGAKDLVPARLRVAAPSWVRPRRALVFLNGQIVGEHTPVLADGEPTDVWLDLELPLPGHDAWVVCVVLGDGVEGPFWPSLNPYTLGATNPVWFDVDRDGEFTAPRQLAAGLIEAGADLPGDLAGYDRAVAQQCLALLWRAWPEAERSQRGQAFVAGAPNRHRAALAEYLQRRVSR